MPITLKEEQPNFRETREKNLTDREKIPNKITWTIEVVLLELDKLSIWLDISEKEKVLKNLEYILEKIYFDKEERRKEYEKLREKKDITEEEITQFLEKESNVLISGEDWQKLMSTWIANWSYWELWEYIEDRIKILSTISYYSLQATLRTGIHTWLFLQNINKYFPHLKDDSFEEFKNDPSLSWWLILTELSSWSDLLTNYKATYIENEDWSFTIEWLKHFQWLTNEASHWIALARNANGRWFRLFLIDKREENQNITMTEEYKCEWLKSITYWKNQINATVPKENVSQLISAKDLLGLKTFVSMLYDSRLQFPAMMVWSIKRIYDESVYQAWLRKISRWKMEENETVKDQLKEIKIRHSIVDLINKYLIYSKINLFEDNSENEDLSIIAKTISTEYTNSAAGIWKRLQWWWWFKQSNIISNIWKDAWPFSIFEWVNEMLYSWLVKIYEKRINSLEEYSQYHCIINTMLKGNSWIELKDIQKLEINDDIKWKIYSRVSLILMINEMKLQESYASEIEFLLNEIKWFISKAKNIQTKFEIL